MSSVPTRPAARRSRRGFVLLIVVAMVLTVGVATVNAVAVSAGYRGHSYAANDVQTPSKDKPQSKVWYTDGFWWAGMMDPAAQAFRIYRLDTSTQSWINTGTTVDARNSSQADYLWDGPTNSLYVASAPEDSDANPILVFKLNYDTGSNTYSHDPDFGAGGVQVGSGPAETVTIAKDSTGQLWVTFDNAVGGASTDRNIMINRSTTAEDVWGSAFSIGTAADGDISGIIAYGGNAVGVLWSDERLVGGVTHFRWSSHSDAAADTAWSAPTSAGSGAGAFAEDHLFLTKPSASSGQVLAAVKTNGGPNHIQVLRRNASTGAWTRHVVVSEGQNVSRPQMVVDATNSIAYVFYVSPENFQALDANIHYKSAPLSTLSFTTSGIGTPFINDDGVRITDFSTTRQPVTASMGGIVGIASGDSTRTYYHGWLPISSSPPPPPPPTHPFTDIADSKFKNDIIWAWLETITAGCSPTRFCPDGLVTRGQMATFLVRALNLPNTTTDYFTDDNGSVHESNINRLRAAGVTAGCGGSRFCPDGLVSRGQMATFLVRGFDLPATGTDYFTDDEGLVHEANINALRRAGVTSGCGGTRYCPSGIVTRGQMAAFLHRATDN